MFVTALVASLLPVLINAQQYGGGPAPTTTSSGPATFPSAPPSTASQINVDVFAGGQYTFNPNNFNASNGTIVTFYFPLSIGHSVTQSSFADPCTHLAATNSTRAGFDSGLVNGMTFSINITDDTKPIWFHCKQVMHCGMGMVGSINAPTTGNNTFVNFKAAALSIGGAEPTETNTGAVTGGVNGVATAPPTTATGSGGSGGSSGSNSATSATVSVVALTALTGVLATVLTLL